jgi:hypothetical protein
MNLQRNTITNDSHSLFSAVDKLKDQMSGSSLQCTDNQTVISDITDNSDKLSNDFEEVINTIKITLNSKLNGLNIDNLRDKCKEIGISGIFKMKKSELIQTLENEFFKLIVLLKDKKVNELKSICKELGIKGITGAKKEYLMSQILGYKLSVFKFRLIDEIKKEENVVNLEQSKIMEQLEKQTHQIQLLEMKLKEEEKTKMDEQKKEKEDEQRKKIDEQNKEEIKKKKKEEKDKQKKNEEEKKNEEDIKKLKEEEEKKKLKEEESKRKKQSIPKNVRVIVWNHYIGEDIIKHKCLCCKKVTISNTNFEVGHVLSEKNSGSHEINNLRPICFSCNHSMGAENMIDFVVKYGLFIG